ncbi:MAG: phosphate butyryltransferase [Synergistetes bacterium]|nr:phosphate butyryltransferase [Synergistota bacterium]MCX8127451.1 phosphate butyryltransferase [Synergistota bacterium]MDW8192772.1 phosphate butyryltransferase [Synergistota bacterium]
MLKSLLELLDIARGKRMRLAVAAAEDAHVLEAVEDARKREIVSGVLVGSKPTIEKIAEELKIDLSNYEIYDIPRPVDAAYKAVDLVREGKCDFLMKGYIQTADLARAVLDKERGLRTGRVLSMVSLFELSTYPRVFAITDAGITIAPELEQKVDLINNAVDVMHKLGYDNPKVAIVSAVEVVNPKIPATIDAAILSKMNQRGQIKGCIIDGPFALDNAVSEEAAKHKKIESQVAGKADILVLPDIDAGNVLYKALIFIAGAKTASVVMGAKVPIVLTSRADSAEAKLLSIALAAVCAM